MKPPGCSDWGPVDQRRLSFNAQMASSGRLDKADLAFIVRDLLPGESPGGGVNQGPVSGAAVGAQQDSYASVMCQEIGHMFLGPDHSSQVDIVDSLAFDLVARRAIPDPISVMFGSVGADPRSFFDPGDWMTIRNAVLGLDSTGPLG